MDESAADSWRMWGLPHSHHRPGWVQHFFPSREFRRLPLHGWFLRCLPGSLLFGGNSRHGYHAVGFSLFSQIGRHLHWRGYTFKNFLVWEGEVAPHLFPCSSFTLSANRHGCPSVGRSVFSTQYWRARAYATVFSPLHLPNVSAGKDRIWEAAGNSILRRHRWCRGCLTVILQSCLPHLILLGWLEWSPYLPHQLFAVLAPLVLLTTLSTSQVFGTHFGFPSHPFVELLSLVVQGRVPFLLLLSSLADPLRKQVTSRLQFQWLLQVRIFGSHHLSMSDSEFLLEGLYSK